MELLFIAIVMAIITHAIAISFEDGEIFEKAGAWLETKLPKLWKPLIGCPVCMAFWYSLPVAGFLFDTKGPEFILLPLVAMGINVIIIRNRPVNE